MASTGASLATRCRCRRSGRTTVVEADVVEAAVGGVEDWQTHEFGGDLEVPGYGCR